MVKVVNLEVIIRRENLFEFVDFYFGYIDSLLCVLGIGYFWVCFCIVYVAVVIYVICYGVFE